MSETRYTPEQMQRIEAIALDYHKTQEGEYGCNGLTCPGVQRLVELGKRFAADAIEREAAMLRQAATDAEALAAKDERIAALIHERDVLQRISARRAGALERVGLHADCTMEEATALALTGDATEGQG